MNDNAAPGEVIRNVLERLRDWPRLSTVEAVVLPDDEEATAALLELDTLMKLARIEEWEEAVDQLEKTREAVKAYGDLFVTCRKGLQRIAEMHYVGVEPLYVNIARETLAATAEPLSEREAALDEKHADDEIERARLR